MAIKNLVQKMCLLTFLITALTSIPLFIRYVKGVTPKFQLIVDLHVWFGLAFIIFVLIRISTNKRFVKAIIGWRKK